MSTPTWPRWRTRSGPRSRRRLVQEAKAGAPSQATEADRAAAADARRFDVSGPGVPRRDGARRGRPGPGRRVRPQHRGRCGCLRAGGPGSPVPGRAPRQALGDLARAQLALGFQSPEGTPKPRVPRRQVVLHAHLAAAAVHRCPPAPAASPADLARVQEVLAAVTTEQVRQWCGNPDTTVTVKPVLDLAEHIWVMSYEASDRLKTQTAAAGRHLHPPVLHPGGGQLRLRAPVPSIPSTPTAEPPVPATPRPRADPTIGPRPPATGTTSPSSAAPTCGAHPWATSTSATTPAPSTSPPMRTDAATPASSSPTSTTTRPTTSYPAPRRRADVAPAFPWRRRRTDGTLIPRKGEACRGG